MFLVYIWLYTLFLTFIWWFFIVVRIHAYKFKDFSNNITKITNLLFIFLLILSVLGYFLISYWSDFNKNYSVELNDSWNSNYKETDY